jgi:hypothetical protein
MTRARIKALHDKVTSILATLDLDTPLDGMLPHAETLCVIRYKFHQGYEEEEDIPLFKGEEAKVDGLEEKKEDEEMMKKEQGKEEKREREREAGTSRPKEAGASTQGWQVAGAKPARAHGGETGSTGPSWPVLPVGAGRHHLVRGEEWEAGTSSRRLRPWYRWGYPSPST